MKTLIVANWKMNPASQKEAKELFNTVKKGAKLKNAEVVICPPFIYLPLVKGLTLGAQNVSIEEKGPFTGEISILQLKDLGVEYVIIGHSERRKYFSETNEIVNKKIKNVLNVGLKVIFCIGENAGEDKTAILEKQLKEGLAGVSNVNGPADAKALAGKQLSNVVIVYEPVWAIGTGKNCSIEDTISAVALIKKIVSGLYGSEATNNIRILYGGSVNSSNCAEYVKNAQVDGLLVGGASLDAKEFIEIVKSVK